MWLLLLLLLSNCSTCTRPAMVHVLLRVLVVLKRLSTEAGVVARQGESNNSSEVSRTDQRHCIHARRRHKSQVVWRQCLLNRRCINKTGVSKVLLSRVGCVVIGG